ncbi:PIN domain protein [Pirellulimonas nuda]|uniref:PIN domain protein n=1 Tax=Pirellulimonas nuda TaxID=2528009 RepID=A0A518DEI3_9BACT|nr:type II toxin-antitoxin system VapC family toxin [Pirellulimonas nuda]QDU89884.1 PIN domain protein [Pirellulimonas nuda]
MSQVLIDTQALIWFAENAPALSAAARALVDDPNTVRLASSASLWEMAIKIRLGKLTLRSGSLRRFAIMLRDHDVEVLDVSTNDAIGVGDLPTGEHKDPFDRLLAAQCLGRRLTLVSIDTAFDAYGVRRVW